MLKVKDTLNKLVQQMATRFNTQASWTTVTSSEGTVEYKIIKGMVVLNIYDLSPTTTWKKIATLPAAVRPPAWTGCQGYCGPMGRYNMSVAISTASGDINISAPIATNDGTAVITYPQNN